MDYSRNWIPPGKPNQSFKVPAFQSSVSLFVELVIITKIEPRGVLHFLIRCLRFLFHPGTGWIIVEIGYHRETKPVVQGAGFSI
jgi:hypothetical protein